MDSKNKYRTLLPSEGDKQKATPKNHISIDDVLKMFNIENKHIRESIRAILEYGLNGGNYIKIPQGVTYLDVYTLCGFSNITLHPMIHCMKKMLFLGKRGKNTVENDTLESLSAITRAPLIMIQMLSKYSNIPTEKFINPVLLTDEINNKSESVHELKEGNDIKNIIAENKRLLTIHKSLCIILTKVDNIKNISSFKGTDLNEKLDDIMKHIMELL